MTTAREALARRLSEGVLAFPATPFTESGGLDSDRFAAHIADLAGHGPAALVAAGGAGELFSLTVAEQEALCRIAVAQKTGVPVIAGVGQGLAIAIEMAKAAERAGVDAILVFPPYLIAPEQEGLAAYLTAICRAVGIGVIAYSRNNGIVAADTALAIADACRNFIAVKDGTGDFEALVALKQRAGDRLLLINGVPTAEIIARQCFAMGIRSYTSAVFSFLPELAIRFFRAARDGEEETTARLLRDFYVPLTEIRRRRRGYAVSLVKAGLRLTGRPAGPVRAPLIELTAADERALGALIALGIGLAGEPVAARKAAV